jgi:hypothetical protein
MESALSLGERVARYGVFISRWRPGEGFLQPPRSNREISRPSIFTYKIYDAMRYYLYKYKF